MSSSGTSREHCVQGLEHKSAHRQREIYDLLQESGPMTSKEVAEAVGIKQSGARSTIQKLRRDGHVEARPDLEYPNRNVYEVAKDD